VRAVVQRVRRASVHVDGRETGAIGHGLLVLLGVAREDTPADAEYVIKKILHGRYFDGPEGRPMDRSVAEVGGGILVVSQFTLYGDVRRGKRPAFDQAAPADLARATYEDVVRQLRAVHQPVATGEFQAMMQVELVNDGPITILIDSLRHF
jgi:D-tyrosyl-tRNA(Tyr) deacylase